MQADYDDLRSHHATLQREFGDMMELAEHRQRELRTQSHELKEKEAELADLAAKVGPRCVAGSYSRSIHCRGVSAPVRLP